MDLLSAHLDSCELKPLWRNHAHLFAPVAFVLVVLAALSTALSRVTPSIFRFVELLDKFLCLHLLRFTIHLLVERVYLNFYH